MKNKLLLSLTILILSGCATYTGVGSQVWYDQRMIEVDTAHKAKQITDAQYLSTKNEIDQIRVDYLRKDSCGPQTSFGFGIWH